MISYEKFNPKIHSKTKIANLIYDVDFRTFKIFYKDKNKAIEAIEKTLNEDENLNVILDNGNIVGVVLIYTSDSSYKFVLKPFRLFLIDILDYFVLCDIKKDDLYIADIAIDQLQRGKGLGSQVLNDIIEYANENNFKRVILDADFRNTQAKALYERLGFKVFNKKRVKIGGFERGMYNMELIL